MTCQNIVVLICLLIYPYSFGDVFPVFDKRTALHAHVEYIFSLFNFKKHRVFVCSVKKHVFCRHLYPVLSLKQVYDGCQSWELAFIVQAYCSTGLANEFGPTLRKAHEFIKSSQVQCSLSHNLVHYCKQIIFISTLNFHIHFLLEGS